MWCAVGWWNKVVWKLELDFASGSIVNMYCCPTQMKANCFWSSVCRNGGIICQNSSCVSGTMLEIRFGLPSVLVVIKFRIQLFCMNSCVFRISQTVTLNEYLLGIATFASCNSLIIPPGVQCFVWREFSRDLCPNFPDPVLPHYSTYHGIIVGFCQLVVSWDYPFQLHFQHLEK